MSLETIWWPRAEGDLRNIRSWRDAAWISAEVARYAEDGIGDLRRVVLPSGVRAYALFLPSFRVLLTLDRTKRTIHVWRVLRALPNEG